MSDMMNANVTETLMERILLLDDSLACVATIHLCVEYWINRLINEKSPSATQILGDPRNYRVPVKLAIIWNLSILPEPLCSNIEKLDRLRTQCAYDLNVDFTQMDLDYADPDGHIELDQFRDRLISGDEDTIKALLRWIGMFTLGWLSKHCIEHLHMKG